MTRTSTITRETRETTVSVSLDLDGRGEAAIATGIGMLDHLLGSFAHHAMIDLAVTTEGDLHVDDHHTIEDTFLVLGSAIDEALGDRAGIRRFGNAAVPMDEALARCAIDFGGRPWSVVEASFRADRLGAMSTQMIPHGLDALARTSGATIHLSATGRNDHHVAESMFKALAIATRAAVEIDPRRTGIPSTKGTM
jgi:imidazoleglycerol-phosphate dehydratase